MKRIYLYALLCILGMQTANAQSVRVLGGISANASKGNLKGLNFVLDRYNQTRQGNQGQATIISPMGNINWVSGLGWQVGISIESDRGALLYLGLNRVGRSATTFATVVDVNGNRGQRDVKFSSNSINSEVALGARGEHFVGMLGGSFDLINSRAYTKINSDKYNKVLSDLNIGISLFFDASYYLTERFSVGIRPYVQLAFLETDFYDLNRAINPNSYFNDYSETYSRFNNWGAQVFVRIASLDE